MCIDKNSSHNLNSEFIMIFVWEVPIEIISNVLKNIEKLLDNTLVLNK